MSAERVISDNICPYAAGNTKPSLASMALRSSRIGAVIGTLCSTFAFIRCAGIVQIPQKPRYFSTFESNSCTSSQCMPRISPERAAVNVSIIKALRPFPSLVISLLHHRRASLSCRAGWCFISVVLDFEGNNAFKFPDQAAGLGAAMYFFAIA